FLPERQEVADSTHHREGPRLWDREIGDDDLWRAVVTVRFGAQAPDPTRGMVKLVPPKSAAISATSAKIRSELRSMKTRHPSAKRYPSCQGCGERSGAAWASNPSLPAISATPGRAAFSPSCASAVSSHFSAGMGCGPRWLARNSSSASSSKNAAVSRRLAV